MLAPGSDVRALAVPFSIPFLHEGEQSQPNFLPIAFLDSIFNNSEFKFADL
jgi:hypothetical protein